MSLQPSERLQVPTCQTTWVISTHLINTMHILLEILHKKILYCSETDQTSQIHMHMDIIAGLQYGIGNS